MSFLEAKAVALQYAADALLEHSQRPLLEDTTEDEDVHICSALRSLSAKLGRDAVAAAGKLERRRAL